MREEIIPQMLKTQHLINPDMKIEDIEDLEEFNPEWKKSLDMANEKIRELGELQMEGADTYMGTFAQLKTFPFFQQAAHWFYPFSTQISEVASILPPAMIRETTLSDTCWNCLCSATPTDILSASPL